MEDLYSILGVPEKATAGDIKKAYRAKSMKYHPDRSGGNTEKFQKVNEAYQTLGDDQKRRIYDMQRNNPLMGALGGGGFPPEDIMNMFFGGGAGMPGFQGMGGMFPEGARVRIFHGGHPAQSFNMGGMGQRLRKPAPIIKSIEITLAEAYAGVNVPVEIERWVYEDGAKKMEKERIYVDVHAGIDDNEMIILRERGNALDEHNKGDIKLFVNIKNTSHFQRKGLNLIYAKKITLKEALVGFSFDIKHLSGKTYTINNTNGKVITPFYIKTIQHMGMRRKKPHPAPSAVGDLIITFDIKFPSSITPEQQELLCNAL